MIIVACNTVSAYALDEMNESADCPVIGVVEAGVLATANSLQMRDANILIIGTNATINSKAYEDALRLQKFTNLNAKATPLLVPLVEEEILSGEILNATLKHYFANIERPQAVILGCTHFPLLTYELQTYFGKETKLIHSGDAIVEYLQDKFNFYKQCKNPQLEFFASENPEALRTIAKRWLDV